MKKIILLSTFYFLLSSSAFAQAQPVFMTSFKSYNFIPPEFNGKAMPLSSGTTIDVAFEILNNDKPLDISRNNVKFFVNDKKRSEGIGLHRFRFVTSGGQPGQAIRVVVLNSGDEMLYENRFTIPTSAPEIVISHPYSLNLLNKSINYFKALPYFFNIERLGHLSFNWSVNGAAPQETDENPDMLELDIPQEFPSGVSVTIRATAQNQRNQLEISSETINLTVK